MARMWARSTGYNSPDIKRSPLGIVCIAMIHANHEFPQERSDYTGHVLTWTSHILPGSGEGIHNNGAPCDKFLQFGTM